MDQIVGLKGRKHWAIVLLIGLLVMACQLPCNNARRLVPWLNTKSSLVLHFQPSLQSSDSGYSAMESNGYVESYEKHALMNENEENDIEEEEEEKEIIHEPHPADELLQFHKADGTKSYILGGY
eukprot:Gb_29576 [translate_table: standard]